MKTVFGVDFSEINKRGGSNKACTSWKTFRKKNKKTSMLIRDFRVHMTIILQILSNVCGFLIKPEH